MVFRKFDNARFRLYCWLFCVVTVLGVACLLSWLSLTPKNPRFEISDTQVIAFDSNFNHSTDHRNLSTADLIFSLKILNPNKRMGISYSGITLDLYKGSGIIGTNSTPAFYQGYKNTTLLNILIHTTQEGFQGQINGGVRDYMIRVQTDVRFRIMRWKTKLRQIEYRSIFHAAEEVQGQAPAPAVEIKTSSDLTF